MIIDNNDSCTLLSEDFSQTESHGPHTGTGQHGPDEANVNGYFLFLERTGETSDDFSTSDPRIRTPYYQVGWRLAVKIKLHSCIFPLAELGGGMQNLLLGLCKRKRKRRLALD